MMNPILIRLESEEDFNQLQAASQDTKNNNIPMFRVAANTDINGSSAGIWECTPGKFRRQVAQAEFSYIISGSGTFTVESGEVIEFVAGDALYFEPNTQGEWHIKQTVRKSYFIVK